MKRKAKWFTMALLVPGLLAQNLARADDQAVSLSSNSRRSLPPGTSAVELTRQTGGSCHFGRTWGYDLATRDLWTNNCAGAFKIIVGEPDAAVPNSSNTAAALAAAAAIAGVAVLASRGHKNDDSDNTYQSGYNPGYAPGYNQGYYPQPGNPGYYPPNAGYYPPTAGNYPAGGGRQGTIHGPGGLCLDMRGDRINQGTEAIIYRCHGRNNQRFNWTPRGELIVANMCLDIQGGSRANGARVIAWPCNGGKNQQWFVSGSQIRSQRGGKCLDVAGGYVSGGTPIVVNDCNGSPTQRWFW